MGFMNTYKRLDNLCRDMNNIGVTGYINDMEEIPNGSYYVFGWENDYQKLKHYRYIRNQIAHESYADEENMCSDEDEEWLKKFHKRILERIDPLALYQKEITSRRRTDKSVSTKSYRTTTDMYANSGSLSHFQKEITSQQHTDRPVNADSSHKNTNFNPSNSSGKRPGYAAIIFLVAVVLVIIFVVIALNII